MRKLALGSLVLTALLVIATAIFLVFAREQDRGGASFQGALRDSSPAEELAILPAPSTPDVTQRREVDEEQSRAGSKTAAVCSLHGFVLPASGSTDMPLDKLVELVDEHAAVEWTRIDASGAYSLEHLVPGHYWLTSGSSREDRAWAEVVLDPNEPSQRVDLRLESSSELRVQIRVVDTEGHALENRELTPIATSQPPGDWFDEITGNRGNHFGVGQYSSAHRDDTSLDGSIGYLLLDAEPPVYVSLVRGMRVIATKLVDALDDDVVFTIDRGSPLLRNASVRWRLVDPVTREAFEGEPTSTLRRLSGEWRRLNESLMSGERVIRDVEPGPYALTLQLVLDEEHRCARPLDWRKYKEFCDFSVPGVVSCGVSGPAEDRFERTIVLWLNGGEARDLGEIAITEGMTIAGDIRGPQDDGIRVFVECKPLDPRSGRAAHLGGHGQWTDDEGSFRFRGLDPGEYLVCVRDYEATWGAACLLVDVSNESVCDVELRVAPPVKCSLRPSLASWRAQRFELRDELGLPIIGVERFESPRPRELLLAPGRYELRSWILPSSTPTTRTIEIVDETVAIELR